MNAFYFLPILIFVLAFIIMIPKFHKDRKAIEEGTELLKNCDVLLLSEISGIKTINEIPLDLIPKFSGSQLGNLIPRESEGNADILGLHEGDIKIVCKPSIMRETPLTKEMVLYYSNETNEISFQGVKGSNYRLCLLDKKEMSSVNVISTLEIVFRGWITKDTLYLCVVKDDNSESFGDLFAMFHK